jgi:hypothetical protein
MGSPIFPRSDYHTGGGRAHADRFARIPAPAAYGPSAGIIDGTELEIPTKPWKPTDIGP